MNKCTKQHSAEGVLSRTSPNGKSIFKTKAAGTLEGWPTDMGKGFIESPAVRGPPDSFPILSAPEHYSMRAARLLVNSILKIKLLDA